MIWEYYQVQPQILQETAPTTQQHNKYDWEGFVIKQNADIIKFNKRK